MELDGFFGSLRNQEKEYRVKISFHPDVIRDERHLNCLWYGGEVGRIKYNDYDIVIGAYGDIRLYGKINGREIYFKDRNNSGDSFSEFGKLIDDELLYKLLQSEDEHNFLRMEDGNWFEVDLISPTGNGLIWLAWIMFLKIIF